MLPLRSGKAGNRVIVSNETPHSSLDISPSCIFQQNDCFNHDAAIFDRLKVPLGVIWIIRHTTACDKTTLELEGCGRVPTAATAGELLVRSRVPCRNNPQFDLSIHVAEEWLRQSHCLLCPYCLLMQCLCIDLHPETGRIDSKQHLDLISPWYELVM